MLSASKSGSGLATGYNLTRSLRFRASASAYLNRTPSVAGNRQIWTWSGWVKRGSLGVYSPLFIAGTSSGQQAGSLAFSSVGGVYDKLELNFGVQGISTEFWLQTTQVFRDPSAWYHIVVSVDTTQATASNRVKFYVNGSQITALSSYGGYSQYPSQNYNTSVNNTVQHLISRDIVNTAGYFDGYLTEVNFIDGQALTPSSFGSTNALTGVWQPARYTGTYGTNGFYLPFTDNSALTTSSNVGLGKDFSGNGNYWTTNNISLTAGTTYDSMTDVPTLTSATAANFAVLNPLDFTTVGTVADGNLKFTQTSAAARSGRGSIGVSSGKWYWEVTNLGGNNSIGIQNAAASLGTYCGGDANGWSYFVDGNKYNNNSGTTYGAAYTTNDVIGVALDLTAGTLTFYKNNTSQGVAYSGLSGTIFAGFSSSTGGGVSFAANFGQRPFTYTPPTGFVALNTYNLPTSTIVKGNTVMDATLYTGTGANLTVTNAAPFKPDLVWIKVRSNAVSHALTDSVRGISSILSSDLTSAQATQSVGQGLTAFNSNGFSLGTQCAGSGDTNFNGRTYVGWQWQAGQGTTSSNTNGTITSTVSVNASAGFSVVTYTGTGANATVGHGLGVAPQFIITKNRSAASAWHCYVAAIPNMQNGYIVLNSTAAFSTSTNTVWNGVQPTSSVFSVGTDSGTNGSGNAEIAYCWTPIAGYSAFGSYSGNNSTDGPMVYTGFQPKFVLIKGTGNASGWQLQDSARNTYNVVNAVLRPDLSAAESTGYGGVLDFLSNGFKLRTTDTNYNSSSYGPYIYMAFATNPFKNSLGF